MTRALGWRVCPKVARRVFPVDSPFARGMDADDLRDWTGSSTLIEAYPEYAGNYLRGNEREQPYAGWHWGNRGGVSSAAIEKPHRSGWRPLLECEFDLAYTPLMELDYGQGRVIVCTLDLEDHVVPDPAARRMAGRIVDYALHRPPSSRASKVVYVGGSAGAAWLDKIGVNYQRSATAGSAVGTAGAGLLLIGPDAALDAASLRAYLEQGGKVFFLPRSQADGGLGATLKPAAADFAGSLSVPEWPEADGLSASDLALAYPPGDRPLGRERRRGYRSGRSDRPQSDRKGPGRLLPSGPGSLPRRREDLFPLLRGGGPPVPLPSSWPIWAPVSRWTAAYFIPMTPWLLTWVACGRRR